jgi:4-hydroxymandelate oxidase
LKFQILRYDGENTPENPVGDEMKGFKSGRVTRRAVIGGLTALSTVGVRAFSEERLPPSRAYLQSPPPVTAASQVMNVMQFEALAREALPPAHFGFVATGNDDDKTVACNQDAFSHYEIRSRRFVDVSRIDMTRGVFGTAWPTPIYLSAVSGQGAFHTDAELGTARAAHSRSALMMLSSVGTLPIEPVIEARGAPIWQQLYATDDWTVTEGVVRRAQDAGCAAIALTVDSMPNRNNETLLKSMQSDSRTCTQCHINNSHSTLFKAPMYAGLDLSHAHDLTSTQMTWDYLDKLRKLVKVKLLVKGIVTGEDAALCVKHGVDGVIVSNHGGRQEETLRSTLECLPEIADAVHGKVPIFLDGGVRRGTDVFKAIALGATGVGIGRPQAWGLAAFGQSGVEAVLDILTRELTHIMLQAGTPTLADITRGHVLPRHF